MTSISSILTRTLPLPPSCIAFCHTQPDLFLVGTYFLHQNENAVINDKAMPWQKRSGSLILFRLIADNSTSELSIHELCTLPTDFAVLDVQWSPHRPKGREAIGVATSSPMVEFYDLKLSPDGKSAELVSSAWLGPFDDISGEEKTGDILALSLAWHPRRSKVMAVTLSDGDVQFCETEGDFAEINHNMSTSAPEELKHELEAWTAAWSPASAGLFSGGDDCVLRYMRPNAARDGLEASWADRKLHNAGVTAILPLSDELIVTGSYDDHVRLVYAPPVGRRRLLAERNLGGGVWRLKMIESDELPASDTESSSSQPFTCTILASCMHAGARVLRLCKAESDDWSFEITAQFTEHQSMNYGSDVQPHLSPVSDEGALKSQSDRRGDERVRTVVSTSFYDKLLCVWQFDMGARESSAVEDGAER